MGATFFLSITLFLLAISDPAFFQRINDIFASAIGTSGISIQVLRRDLYISNLTIMLNGILRNGVIGPILVTSIILVIERKRISDLPHAAIAVSFFIFCFITTHKATLLYPIIVIGIYLYLKSHGLKSSTTKTLIYSFFGLFFATNLLAIAYKIQYFWLTDITYLDWLISSYSRMFGHVETLSLFMQKFNDPTYRLGIASTPFAEIFGEQRASVFSDIAMDYIGSQTSWQAGFIADGYSSAGILGVIIYALGFSITSAVCCAGYVSMSKLKLQYIYISTSTVCLWYATQLQFFTSLITGGLIALPLLAVSISAIEGKIGMRSARLFYGNQYKLLKQHA